MSWLLRDSGPWARFGLEAEIEQEILVLVTEARAAIARVKQLEEDLKLAVQAAEVAKQKVQTTCSAAAQQGFRLRFGIGEI
jgi:hypothetical protein